MAAINFPASPSNGDTYTENGATYEYELATTSWLRVPSTWINDGAYVYYDGALNVGIGTTTPSAKLHVVGTTLLAGETDITGDFAVDTDTFWVNATNNRIGMGTVAPAVTLDITATDAIKIPNGTTAQRPTGAAGMIRYNSTTGSFEGYTTGWGGLGSGSVIIDTNTDQFTIGPDVFDALLAGVNIQPTDLVNTADGDTLLTVRSGGGSPRLFVQHSGRTGTSNTDFWVGTSSDMTGGNRVFHDAYHPNADTLTTGRTISLTGDVTGTSAAFDGSGNLSFATVVADDSHNHSSSSGGFTTNGTLTVGPTGSSQITTGNNQTRGKISVWTSSTFGIGMGTTYTHGGLSDYAMTFQMDNTANRGWWWGTTTHSNAQGAMSLTNTGRASISGGVRIGYGISDTTTPGATGLAVTGAIALTGDLDIGGAVAENVFTVTGTTPALNPSNGTIQTWALTANSTPTDGLTAGEAITLMIDDGTARTITWPTMTWVNNAGAAPTLATTGYTVVSLWKVSTTLYGALIGNGT